MWTVTIPDHEVVHRHGRTYPVAATEITLGAPDAVSARAHVTRWAHLDSAVPPYRHLLAQTFKIAQAKAVVPVKRKTGS